jgi:hypothetical protein
MTVVDGVQGRPTSTKVSCGLLTGGLVRLWVSANDVTYGTDVLH